MAVRGKSSYPQKAVISCVQSAADTVTFEQLHTGISIHEKVAWRIIRVEYDITKATLVLMTATADVVMMALTRSNAITDLTDWADPAILDNCSYVRLDTGTAANAQFLASPEVVRDYSSMPGGGILVPPNPLYGAVDSSGLADAGTVNFKIWYDLVSLSPAEYWELVEMMQVLS